MKPVILTIMLLTAQVASARSAVVCVDGKDVTEVMSSMNWKLNQKHVYYPTLKEHLGKKIEFDWITGHKHISGPTFMTADKTITMCVTISE